MKSHIVEDLRWRHTAKKYDPSKRVSEEDLAIFFESLRLSASSINSQPWYFIIIESDEARTRMAKTFQNRYQFNLPHVTEASQIILFSYNPKYSRKDYARVVDQAIADGRITNENRDQAFSAYVFADNNTNDSGENGSWTKCQLYLALGNALHTLARLRIDATPMEGVDPELISREFSTELKGFKCELALAIGYQNTEENYNSKLPKSRLSMASILERI
ncbi:nitroreductase family protein [Spongiibacter marinus]|uniref:nitroreductase family protein n=1 Tax=Spongiibacter marinus TaxID=354246 RepID=UPI0035BE9814